MADYLIAGVCLANGGVLLTRNQDRFGRVPNLKLGGRHL
jgi:predicted nucleic acid-binding protein